MSDRSVRLKAMARSRHFRRDPGIDPRPRQVASGHVRQCTSEMNSPGPCPGRTGPASAWRRLPLPLPHLALALGPAVLGPAPSH
eukprot:gene5322-biopygen862